MSSELETMWKAVSTGRITGMRLLGYLNRKRFGSKIARANQRRGDSEGVCLSRATGCGGQRPKVETSSKYAKEKRWFV